MYTYCKYSSNSERFTLNENQIAPTGCANTLRDIETLLTIQTLLLLYTLSVT